MEFSVTKSRYFGVVRLGNKEKDPTPNLAELMGELSGIVATHTIKRDGQY